MSLVIQSVSPHIGAEVIGADLAQPVGDNLFRQLHQAWVDADGLLVIRDQRLTPEQQISFSRQFGELASAGDNPVIQKYTLPGYPEIFRVSNKKQDGEPLGREDAGTYWHSDGTWQTFPSKASLLYGIEIPRVGGNTMFADLYQAWETLTPTMQHMVEGLKAVHAMANAGGTSFEREFTGKGDVVAAKTAIHPLVITHPDSGRKALFVNRGYTARIVGLSRPESDALLGFLFDHSTAPELVYRHTWRSRDLVIWDNRCTAHYAIPDYKAIGDRYLHRTSVKGDRPMQ
ncbi:MAG: TauD/TfdA family dioxygenase [Enhydrobacter sp.]|nr:TauD/TfdA family dioxygenase [Enhydrobacter sp.]